MSTGVSKPIPSYHIYKGTVFELVDQALDFVLSKIARAVGTRAAGAQAPVDYELPREAVAEAIVNAVAHRDYTSNASVQVMLFADRLEIWNPGELPPQLTVDNLRRPHASIPRSPRIAEPLFLARYIEKAGTGTLDMINQCAQAGLPPPEFRQDGGQFIQTLWRPKGAADGAQVAAAGTKSGPSRNPCQSQHWRGFDGFDGGGQQDQPDQVQGPSHPATDGPRLAGNDPARQTYQQPTEIPPHRARRCVVGRADRKQKMNMRERIAGKLSPFATEGGMGRVYQLFGAELPTALEAMNRELVA